MQRLRFTGADADFAGGEEELLGLDRRASRRSSARAAARRSASGEKAALERLARKVAKLHRYDGVELRIDGGRPMKVYRDPVLRISGRASVLVEVRRPPRKRRG